VPKQGGLVETLGFPGNDRSPVAVDASGAYWSDTSGVWRVPTNGSGGATLLGTGDPLANGQLGLVLDESFAYVVECGIVHRISKSGGVPTLLNNTCTSNIGGIAIDETKLFFSVNGSMSNSVWGNPTPALFSLEKAGGKPSAIARASANDVAPPGGGVAVDRDCVYWVEQSDVPGMARGIWQLAR
jgi:hypothetical protein